MWYQKENNIIQQGPCFVYESTTYLIFQDRVELYDNKFLKSNKFVPTKTVVTKKKKDQDYCIMKSEELVIAPLDYLLNNGFKEFIFDGKRKKKSKRGNDKESAKSNDGGTPQS